MNEGQVHLRVVVPANDQAPERLQPGEGAFDFPASPVASQRSSILRWPPLSVGAVRTDELDASLRQPRSQRIAVVRLVCDEARWLALRAAATPARYVDRGERLLDELHFRRRGGVNGCSDRNTFAVDHHHALRSLAAFRLTDFVAPFFAGAKVASANDSSQSSQPRWSRSARNARHTRSQVPSSSHFRSRRQHVGPLGRSSGTSRQRAPVLSTHRIPSRTARLSAHGRPLLDSLGSRGSRRDQCTSVRNGRRRTRFHPHAHLIGDVRPSLAHIRPYETVSTVPDE